MSELKQQPPEATIEKEGSANEPSIAQLQEIARERIEEFKESWREVKKDNIMPYDGIRKRYADQAYMLKQLGGIGRSATNEEELETIKNIYPDNYTQKDFLLLGLLLEEELRVADEEFKNE